MLPINFIRKGMGYEEYLHEYAEYRKIKPEELSEILDRLTESTRGMDSLERMGRLHRRIYAESWKSRPENRNREREGVTAVHPSWCKGAGV